MVTDKDISIHAPVEEFENGKEIGDLDNNVTQTKKKKKKKKKKGWFIFFSYVMSSCWYVHHLTQRKSSGKSKLTSYVKQIPLDAY